MFLITPFLYELELDIRKIIQVTPNLLTRLKAAQQLN